MSYRILLLHVRERNDVDRSFGLPARDIAIDVKLQLADVSLHFRQGNIN